MTARIAATCAPTIRTSAGGWHRRRSRRGGISKHDQPPSLTMTAMIHHIVASAKRISARPSKFSRSGGGLEPGDGAVAADAGATAPFRGPIRVRSGPAATDGTTPVPLRPVVGLQRLGQLSPTDRPTSRDRRRLGRAGRGMRGPLRRRPATGHHRENRQPVGIFAEMREIATQQQPVAPHWPRRAGDRRRRRNRGGGAIWR